MYHTKIIIGYDRERIPEWNLNLKLAGLISVWRR